MKTSSVEGSLGGATKFEATYFFPHDRSKERSLRALFNHGYIEMFHAPDKERSHLNLSLQPEGKSYSNNGFDLFRLTAQGAEVLLDEAFEAETTPLETRIANRLPGLNPALAARVSRMKPNNPRNATKIVTYARVSGCLMFLQGKSE